MSFESMEDVVLSPEEESLYITCVEKNPGMSKKDFKELRDFALAPHSSAVHNFFSVNGVLMEEKPSIEETKELLN